MKKAMRIVVGAMLAVGGLISAAWGGYFTLRGDLVWVIVIIAGASFVVAGVRLIAGHDLKDILRGLLFVLVRSH